MSIVKWMDKKAVVHIHNRILLSYKKNSFESALIRWMKLEPIIQRKVSQKEKHQYNILMRIYGIEKDGNDDYMQDSKRDTDIKNTLPHASNLEWWSISHMVIYMFQYYSLKSPHPHLLPQSPKVCFLHLCLFCCLIYMEFRKMVMITLYARQQKRHRCKEQSFRLCGRRQGWDDLREQHWNMYITICETDCQSRFNAWDRVLRAGALGWLWGMGYGGSWEGGSGWGTHIHPWLIHVNIWQKPLQYCKVISLQLK